MKILIVANYAKEHINKFHIETIKKLKEQGNTVDVVCKADAIVPYCDHLYNIPCERNPFRIQSIQCIRQIRKLIEENHYDIVHCHTLCGRTIGTLAAKKYKSNGLSIVVTCHGLNYYIGSSIMTKLIMPLDYYLMSKADLIFSVNQADIDYMRRHHYLLKKTVLCPPSINKSRFANIGQLKERREIIRVNLGISGQDTVLIYVAEINENKNQIMLLNVVKSLIEKSFRIKLLLVGPDYSNGYVEKKCRDMGLNNYVSFLGWRNDVCDLLCASDIYVASSIREGYGLNLVEAAVCGLPIVATDNRGHREIIENNVSGFLVPVDASSEFADKVMMYVKNDELCKRIIGNMDIKIQHILCRNMADIVVEEYQNLAK